MKICKFLCPQCGNPCPSQSTYKTDNLKIHYRLCKKCNQIYATKLVDNHEILLKNYEPRKNMRYTK